MKGVQPAVLLILLLALQGSHADPETEGDSYGKPADQAFPVLAIGGGDGEVLMRLRRAVSNWNQTVGMLPGYRGWDPMDGDPCAKGKPSWWTGVTCFQGRIDRM